MIALAVLLASLPGLPATRPDAPLDPHLRALVDRCAPELMKEYRLPEAKDLTDDWAAHPSAWHAEADFTGDGFQDTAIMLPRRRGVGFQLLVIVSSATGVPTAVVLLETDVSVQAMGLGVAPPGRYATAVGKGYDFGPDNHDPSEILLTSPAIDFFRFESASVFWYWDKDTRRFVSIQMSD
jgi:hypothetical protein